MTGREAAAVAAATVSLPLAYEFHQLSKGPDGWPFSRLLRLLPVPVRVAVLAALSGLAVWLWPHLLNDPLKTLKELS